MFDSLACFSKLPLSERLQSLNIDWSKEIFQTKCLENYLGMYTITEDGLLLEEIVEREFVEYSEEEQKELKKKSPWLGYKDIIIKSKENKPVSHHGTIVFYTSVEYTEDEDLWVEFIAYFNYGKLDKIEIFKEEAIVSAERRTQEYEEKMRLREADPWYRFKKLLRPFGWRWFWIKMAHLCNKSTELSQKTQNLIYKHLL